MTGIENVIRRSRHQIMSSLRIIIPIERPKHVDGFSRMTSTPNGGKPRRMTCFGFPLIQVAESQSWRDLWSTMNFRALARIQSAIFSSKTTRNRTACSLFSSLPALPSLSTVRAASPLLTSFGEIRFRLRDDSRWHEHYSFLSTSARNRQNKRLQTFTVYWRAGIRVWAQQGQNDRLDGSINRGQGTRYGERKFQRPQQRAGRGWWISIGWGPAGRNWKIMACRGSWLPQRRRN